MCAKYTQLLLFFICTYGTVECGPPQFDKNIQYTNLYLPATMQIIAHLTESMKYELRPSTSSPSTTTTPRPTPPHRPGIFQPQQPLLPGVFKAATARREDTDTNQVPNSLGVIIRHYEPFLPPGVYEHDLELLGEGAKNLHKAIDILENGDLEDFLEKFDDDTTHFNLLMHLRSRKMPPTRAYVTLLSLYDLLSKEAKRLGLNRFNGVSEMVLQDLRFTSAGTSAYQLEHVLKVMQDRRELRDQMAINKIKSLLSDLAIPNSYINNALNGIPPLIFAE